MDFIGNLHIMDLINTWKMKYIKTSAPSVYFTVRLLTIYHIPFLSQHRANYICPYVSQLI